MKKLLTLAIALVAALACLTSCSSDTAEEIAEKTENKYTFDFTFTKEVSETDVETRAVKSEWADGDKVFVFFQNWTDGYLEFTYSSATGNWALAEKAFNGGTPSSPNLPNGGLCMGIWVDGNSLDLSDPTTVSAQTSSVNFPLKEMLVSVGGTVDYYKNGGTVGGVPYTISGNNVSARFAMAQHPCYTKVTAARIDTRSWWFKIKGGPNVAYKPQLEITPNGLTLKTKDMGVAGGYIPAVKNEGENYYFFYNTASYKEQTEKRYERFLVRYTENNVVYEYDRKYNLAMSQHVGQAIKVNWGSDWGNVNHHEYVELGLPSGLKWATRNIGAKSEEEYGYYFAWGETSPKEEYTPYNSITFGVDNSTLLSRGIIDSKGNLTAQYDAATVNWGEGWHMPTHDELMELWRYCTFTYTTLYGVEGLEAKGPNGKSIFLPAAGYYYGPSLSYEGYISGAIWSASAYEDNSNHGTSLSFDTDGRIWLSNSQRFRGLSVRPVTNMEDD